MSRWVESRRSISENCYVSAHVSARKGSKCEIAGPQAVLVPERGVCVCVCARARVCVCVCWGGGGVDGSEVKEDLSS